jgi:uncharacterized membrane protein
MNKSRLEAFSDGVFAIIITIMVLEIKMPQGSTWQALAGIAPAFFSYVISFIFIGIYWGNHHHLLHTLKMVSWPIMLANLNLLFWLSLLPLGTNWMGESHFAPVTLVVYAINLLLSGISYFILQQLILKRTSANQLLTDALRKQNTKAYFSTGCDLLAIPLAYVNPALSCTLFVMQSVIWLIPDRNIEAALNADED